MKKLLGKKILIFIPDGTRSQAMIQMAFRSIIFYILPLFIIYLYTSVHLNKTMCGVKVEICFQSVTFTSFNHLAKMTTITKQYVQYKIQSHIHNVTRQAAAAKVKLYIYLHVQSIILQPPPPPSNYIIWHNCPLHPDNKLQIYPRFTFQGKGHRPRSNGKFMS